MSTKYPKLTGKELIKILEKYGFEVFSPVIVKRPVWTSVTKRSFSVIGLVSFTWHKCQVSVTDVFVPRPKIS